MLLGEEESESKNPYLSASKYCREETGKISFLLLYAIPFCHIHPMYFPQDS